MKLRQTIEERVKSESLKVLLACWAPFRAGAEVAAERLAVGLREAGHHVTVVVGKDGETLARMKEKGLDARFVPLAFTDKSKWLGYRASQRALRQVLQEVGPDVVHANDLPTSQMVGQAARRCGVPIVCHHRWIFEGPAIDWLNKFGADRHVFVSQWLQNAICSRSAGVRAGAGAVVHDGLPLPKVPNADDRQLARRELGLRPDKAIVLYAGQIVERKGVADLLQAWNALSTPLKADSQLVLIGDDLENNGVYRREMERLACELDVAADFRRYQRNVSRWIIASDLCVIPSHEEPLGNATLEAMAHGRPVVATAVGGIPEMVVDQECGLLVRPWNPTGLAAGIAKILSNPSLGARLGEHARLRCERQFSIDAHVDAMVGQYQLACDACEVPVE